MANNNININVTTNADNAGKKFNTLSSSVISSMTQADAMKRAFEFLDKAVNNGKISLQRYGQIVDQLDKEETQLYATLGKTTTAIQSQGVAAASTTTKMSRAAEAAQEFTRKQKMAGKSTNRFGMVSQQVGYQVGDFLVQVQSGANALVAFGQQGTQLAGLLPGLSGAILGIGLSLGTALLGSQLKARNLEIDFKKLGSAFKDAMAPIEPLLSAIGSALSAVGSGAKAALDLVSNNLARVVTYGLTAATVFGVKMVKGFVLAAVASGKFTETLRVGLMRTGIGLLVVALGEAVYQFTRIVKAAGGLGKAFSILGQIAKEAFLSIPTLMEGLFFSWSKYTVDMVLDWTIALKDMMSKVPSFANKVIGAFKGAIDAVREVWLALPDIFVEVFHMAMQKVKDGVQGFVDTTLAGVNWLRDKIGQDPIVPVDLFGAPDPNPAAGAIAAAVDEAKKAFDSAVGQDYVSMAVGVLDKAILSLESQSRSLGKAAKIALDQFKASNPTVQKLVESLRDLEGAGFDVSNVLTTVADDSKKAKDNIESLWESVGKSLESGLMTMVEGTKSVKDAFKDMARDIIKELYRVLVVQEMVGSFDKSNPSKSSGILGFAGKLLTGIFGKASGGTVQANQPYLVGEKGPELIVPRNRGHVMNADLTAGATGGGGTVVVNQSFNFQANGDDSVKKIIAQAAPSIANMAKQSVMDARRRGGAMKNTFG